MAKILKCKICGKTVKESEYGFMIATYRELRKNNTEEFYSDFFPYCKGTQQCYNLVVKNEPKGHHLADWELNYFPIRLKELLGDEEAILTEEAKINGTEISEAIQEYLSTN